ncbi:hypothetical protein ACFCYM_27570 [Streptomyces sp. NPDC056254]|uniref:hypothetical protein n=1 Tax=Streptomyces sp. NPDC056254 TaxID=3345763 RepID=UPI0035E12642
MPATTPRESHTTTDLDAMAALAASHGVPIEDALLIAINLHGISSPLNRHRARVLIRLATAPAVPWQVIVPLNASTSPFVLDEDTLLLAGIPVATVTRIDADEAVGAYFRNDGRAATLNPNARSRCVGCAFCPNTLEAAADPRLSEQRAVRELLDAMAHQHPAGTLTGLEEVTVSTGCFEREQAAVDHLGNLRTVLTEAGITARIGFLTSVLRSQSAFNALARTAGPFVLRMTAECFTRRDLLLKASKAELTRPQMPHVLRRAVRAGHDASFTYIVGLDDLAAMAAGVRDLAPHITEFPNLQVYQAHNRVMAGLRAPGATDLAFYLKARTVLEDLLGPTGLRPQAWECYRPLWHFTFGPERLVPA